MPIEVLGERLRIRQTAPKKGCIYRTQLLGGRKGHAQRIAMKCPHKRWVSQSFTVPLSDVRAMRPTTMKLLGKLGYTREGLKLAGVV
jgi:hypothetical protein